MTEVAPAQRAGEQTRSALGRLTLLVEVTGGTETVIYERRLPDAASARRWCEDKVRRTAEGTSVLEIVVGARRRPGALEIQVIEEVWGRRHAWEATPSRHIPETLQLGLRTSAGAVTWSTPHQVGNDLGTRPRA